MKHTICCLLCLALLAAALTGCAQATDPTEETIPLNEEALEAQVSEYLHDKMAQFKENFKLDDAELYIESIYFNEIIPQSAAADGKLSCSVRYELRIPSLSEDLMQRAGTRSLSWRDVQLGVDITEYLSIDALSLEGYKLDKPSARCSGIRTKNDELLTFDIQGDEDYGCGTIGIASNFTDTGAYEYDWLYYSNPNLESNYYSKAEYEANATPAPVSVCRACRGMGFVMQYATNSWWDEGYLAECELCN